MAAKIKINSRRMTPSLVAERGDAHPCDGAEDDVPRPAEKTFGQDRDTRARQPDRDVRVTSAEPDRECEEHRWKREVEAESRWIADHSAYDMPRNPGGKPGAVKKYTGTDEKTAESSAARRRLVLALGRLAHRQRPILVGDEPGDEKRATGGESGERAAKRCPHEDEAQAEEEGRDQHGGDGERHCPKAQNDELDGAGKDHTAHQCGLAQRQSALRRECAEDKPIGEDADRNRCAAPHPFAQATRLEERGGRHARQCRQSRMSMQTLCYHGSAARKARCGDGNRFLGEFRCGWTGRIDGIGTIPTSPRGLRCRYSILAGGGASSGRAIPRCLH